MRNEKYKNQYERYDFLKRIHICTNCGNEEAELNSILCIECKEKIYKRNKKYYRKNKQVLKEKNKEYFKKLYYERKTNGICTKCGKRKVCKNSQTLCIDCYVRKKKKKDKRWNNAIPRSERVSVGLCYVCGKPREIHETLCDKCFYRASTNMRKLNANPTEKMIKARKEYGEYMFKFKESLFIKKK